MAKFADAEWWRLFIAAVNASERYREVAAGWEGDVVFEIQAEPDRNVPETIRGRLDLWNGVCRGGGLVTEEEANRAAYRVSAPYSRWRDVLSGKLNPVRGIMQGKLKLQGNLAMIIRYVKAADELVRIAQTIPTEFEDA